MAEMTVASILSTIGTVVTEITTMFTGVMSFVTANALLFTGIILPIALVLFYKGFKLLKRAFGR